jgi:hypothetical protein
MRNMAMDGEYLYLLNAPGNDDGPLLTFNLSNDQISLANDGRAFITPDDSYPFVFRNNIQLFDALGNKYLTYHQQACRDRWSPGGNSLFRIESGLPVMVRPPAQSGLCFIWDRSYKNGFGTAFNDYNTGSCIALVTILGEDEQFQIAQEGDQVAHNHIYRFGSYQGPDTELWSEYGRSVGCSTDDLPAIEHDIFPSGPISGNCLVMGRASDSEEIRRVFGGYPLCVGYWRMQLFHQVDGTTVFMGVIPEIDPATCPGYRLECPLDHQATYLTIAEDFDGDSKQSPDAPWDQDMRCIQFKPEPDPMPEGAVEIQPCSDAAILSFSGWAVDNSGIWQGWLLSEDAQVLVPLTVGLSRPDIGAQYPGHPGSANAGFSVTYDASAIAEGEYQFTVRLLANDFQVLDFGPYTIVRDTSHPRPLSHP